MDNKAYNIAAIDIGSNAARILIKQVENTEDGIRMKKLQFLRIPLRLGMDVFSEGKIGNEREKMLVRTMKIFRQLLIIYNVEIYKIYATSAFRDAKNGKSILNDIKEKTGLEITIISGEEEARIIHDNFYADGNLLYVDVGGGSTELSLVCDGEIIESRSINIGTLRLLNDTVNPQKWQDMMDEVKEITDGVDNLQIVGSGGNINKLVRLANENDKKKNTLSVETLSMLYTKLINLTIRERMITYDLRESRADVIVPAAQIFLIIAGLVHANTIIVPNVGLADGMINMMTESLFENNN